MGSKGERRLRVTTWNFSRLCSKHKQKEVGKVLAKNGIMLLVRSLGRKMTLGCALRVTNGLDRLIVIRIVREGREA